jgi:hypothetical protein
MQATCPWLTSDHNVLSLMLKSLAASLLQTSSRSSNDVGITAPWALLSADLLDVFPIEFLLFCFLLIG